jgi:WG containing repeat
VRNGDNIDKNGKFVINPQYNYASKFENGFAEVGVKDSSTEFRSDKFGYIDKTGKYIWQPSD